MLGADHRGRRALRRRLTALVYRDAARAYGVGLMLAMLPAVYLYREWPPWAIRDALRGLDVETRAATLAIATMVYGLVTRSPVRMLLASERLRWWWTLPLSGAWWRALHLRHLLLLDGPWLLAIGYGVMPQGSGDSWATAIASGLSLMALTLAGQVALAAVLDRGAWMTIAGVGAWGLVVAAFVWLPPVAAVVVGASALVIAVRRLGRPMPEALARRRGAAGGHPVVALARLGALAVRRRESVALAWGTGVQLIAVGLVALATARVGAVETSAALALQRGIAIVCATVGTVVCLRAVRLLDEDRPLLDSWGIAPRHERRARLLLAAAGVLPAAIVGTPLLFALGPTGRGWLLQLGIATAWAAVGTVTASFAAEARRELRRPVLPRTLLRMGTALVLVGVAGSLLVLLPWALLDALRLPSAQGGADRARLRFETPLQDDHQA